MLGGAGLCLHMSRPFGLRARGCRLALVGLVYARVHEWWFGLERRQAPCVGIDLHALKTCQYRVPE